MIGLPFQDLVVTAVALGAAAVILRRVVSGFVSTRASSGCSSCRSGCSAGPAAHDAAVPLQIRRF